MTPTVDPLAPFEHVRAVPRAAEWLALQVALQRSANTVSSYGHGLNDFLSFCAKKQIDAEQAGRVDVAAFVRDMADRPPEGGRSAKGLANATVRQRLTVVRLFYDHLIEEGLRATNPVPRGTRHQRKSLVPTQRRLPWIPTDEQWNAILQAARPEPLRNRFMLALAYDCALRREELCFLDTGDIDPAHRTITIRAETTKTKQGRCIPFSLDTLDLYMAYLRERRTLANRRGPLFLSSSTRNRAEPITRWTWSKVVRRIALRAEIPKLSTHSFRHLCLTDLARSGWEIHEIATFAGHRSIQTTLIYIHLSARDLSAKLRDGMASIHATRIGLLGRQAT